VGPVPLTLITGPANAAKAGAVLERFRAALPREPLLVVPTSADVEHYQRELATFGMVFGGEVLTFARLMAIVARRAGVRGRPLGAVACAQVLRSAVSEVALERLDASSGSPGFVSATGRLLAELERSLVASPRFTEGMRTWGAAGGQSEYAEEVAGLYAAYLRRLERLGRVDAEGFAWAALDALRRRPASWGTRPVFMYGFDDLTPTELDAVEALARLAGADVTVALPYEPGRAAFAGRAGTIEALRPLADEEVVLPDRAAHYASGARPALHHLERNLFEAPSSVRSPNGAVRLLEAGGERAEAELVGAEILELLQAGVGATEIAVLFRSPDGAAPLVEAIFASYGIPVAHDRLVALGRTRLGSGLLAFVRVALDTSTPEDLLTWLRTPGKLGESDLADVLEAKVRRNRLAEVQDARRTFEALLRRRQSTASYLAELDFLCAASRDGDVPACLAGIERELESIWTAPHRRAAAVLDADSLADAAVAGGVRAALAELRSLHRADATLLDGPRAVLEALEQIEVPEHGPAGARSDGVLLSDPLAIRARRFRAVFVCGLQDGAFPLRPGPEPFLGDDDRRALATVSGIRLPSHEDALDRERFLFYLCASRPEEVLFLSWCSSDEEGNPIQASPFVEDVRELFDDDLWENRGRRLLADVTWPPALAPTPLELRRAAAAAAPGEETPAALAPPRTPVVLAGLARRERESARGLETFAACGVRWLVEHLLHPNAIEPDPEPMRRGALAHALLERTLRGLRDRTGSARLAPDTLATAEAELEVALAELVDIPAGAGPRAALRSLEVDLRRALRSEAEGGPGYEPSLLEWSFGREGDEHPSLRLADGAVEVTGRVDRIDLEPRGGALVRDYKNRTVHAGAKWADDGRLQVALYALAARELLELEPVGAVYQPLAGPDLRPRGLVCAGGEGTWVLNDVVDPDAFGCALQDARVTALQAARDMVAGRITPCPERCSPRGCAYPTICRAAE